MAFVQNDGTPELKQQFPIGAQVEEDEHEYMTGTILGYGMDTYTIHPTPIVLVRWGRYGSESWITPTALRRLDEIEEPR